MLFLFALNSETGVYGMIYTMDRYSPHTHTHTSPPHYPPSPPLPSVAFQPLPHSPSPPPTTLSPTKPTFFFFCFFSFFRRSFKRWVDSPVPTFEVPVPEDEAPGTSASKCSYTQCDPHSYDNGSAKIPKRCHSKQKLLATTTCRVRAAMFQRNTEVRIIILHSPFGALSDRMNSSSSARLYLL